MPTTHRITVPHHTNPSSVTSSIPLSRFIINAYKRMGHGAKLTSSKAARIFLLAVAMYVDNTDLIHWANSSHIGDKELVDHSQQATMGFGKLAQSTGYELNLNPRPRSALITS